MFNIGIKNLCTINLLFIKNDFPMVFNMHNTLGKQISFAKQFLSRSVKSDFKVK